MKPSEFLKIANEVMMEASPIPEHLMYPAPNFFTMKNRISLLHGDWKRKYPFRHLAVGDWFFADCAFNDVMKKINSLTSCRSFYQKRLGRKFRLQIVRGGLSCTSGVRCWRVQ